MRKFKNGVIFSFGPAFVIVPVGQDWEDVQATDLRCPDCDTIHVARIIDGDTLVSAGTRVRLYGVDTPEIGYPCADDASDCFKNLAGNTARVEPGPRPIDSYGRTPAYAYTEGGASIDELLVREGWAVAWTRDGQTREHLIYGLGANGPG